MFLRFIEGQFTGAEFPLKRNREFTIGRSSEHDMVLDEDMVSRNHAKISTFGNNLTLEDSGSTNGTMVNGQEVSKVALRAGDKILIGQSVMEVVFSGDAEPKSVEPPVMNRQERVEAPTAINSFRFFSGKMSNGKPSLLDLITEMKTLGATGAFFFNHATDGQGQFELSEGQITGISLNLPGVDPPKISPRKAFLRMALWALARFKFEPGDSSAAEPLPIDQWVEDVQIESDLFREYQTFLPADTVVFRLCTPLASRLSELSVEALDTLQLVINHQKVRMIVDHGRASDLEIYQDLLYLTQNGYIFET